MRCSNSGSWSALNLHRPNCRRRIKYARIAGTSELIRKPVCAAVLAAASNPSSRPKFEKALSSADTDASVTANASRRRWRWAGVTGRVRMNFITGSIWNDDRITRTWSSNHWMCASSLSSRGEKPEAATSVSVSYRAEKTGARASWHPNGPENGPNWGIAISSNSSRARRGSIGRMIRTAVVWSVSVSKPLSCATATIP